MILLDSETFEKLVEEHEELKNILRELLTPPLRFGDKKQVIEKAQLIIEGWREVRERW